MRSIRVSWVAVLVSLWALGPSCTLDGEGLGAPAAGTGGVGTGGSGGIGGAGGTGGAGGIGGVGGIGGSAGTSGAAGAAAGAGGIAGAAGSAGSAGSAGMGDPCGGSCTSPHATCVSDVCTCDAGFTNIDSDADPHTASCVPSDTIVDAVVTVGIDHSRLGDLVLKLAAPDGTTITLMNRAGYDEPADDGAGNQEGDRTDLDASYPVHFTDAAQYSAEDMGQYINAGDQAVCRDNSSENGGPGTKICDYTIGPGAAGGPTSLAAGLADKRAGGTWELCAGDAVDSRQGILALVQLDITTVAGLLMKSEGGLNLTIPDNAYDGSLGSMACQSVSF